MGVHANRMISALLMKRYQRLLSPISDHPPVGFLKPGKKCLNTVLIKPYL